MVAQKFGKNDPDLASRTGRKGKTKEISDKQLKGGPGSDVAISAKVGGISNRKTSPSSKK